MRRLRMDALTITLGEVSVTHTFSSLSTSLHCYYPFQDCCMDYGINQSNRQGELLGEVVKNQWGSYCVQHSMSSLT